ncbi:MAG: hypothetical protein F4Y34_10975 [Gammaproteobacteria bacterium]|nr:hypothetical protein [Gammaproteobacteria bacterium]MYH84261.1 hypothetical protein [Gammaproteobacteria bacterium]
MSLPSAPPPGGSALGWSPSCPEGGIPPAALPGSPGLEEEGVPGTPGGLDKVGRPGFPGDEEEDDGEEGIPCELDCDGACGIPL